jgi:hypothetical protein
MDMTIREAHDLINVLVQELGVARQDATNAKIQFARAQRELVEAYAKIAEIEKQAPSKVVALSAGDVA